MSGWANLHVHVVEVGVARFEAVVEGSQLVGARLQKVFDLMLVAFAQTLHRRLEPLDLHVSHICPVIRVSDDHTARSTFMRHGKTVSNLSTSEKQQNGPNFECIN
jgi:hypothetical protein